MNKPPGMTSHDVVALLRRRLGTRRIGHTGTLDPMAQGLLILLVGTATKRQQEFQGHEKTYEAILALGTQTETGDATGRVVRRAEIPALDASRVSALLASLIGSHAQTPPAYSAVKVRGRPSYWWARHRQPVALQPRTVHIVELVLRELTPETVSFRVRCSAGTYVRSLAELIAGRLGTCGHLKALTRVQSGLWSLKEAVPTAWISEAPAETIAERLLPMEQLDARLQRP